MAGFDVSRVIAAFEAGRQQKQQDEDRMRQAEDRKFEIEKRGIELKALKLVEKQQARQEAMQTAQLLQGQPGPKTTTGTPGARLMPESFAPEGGVAPIPSSIPASFTTAGPLPKIPIPGVTGPGIEYQPQSAEEALIQQRQQKMFESQLKQQENKIEIPAIPGLGLNQPTTLDSRVASPLLGQMGQNVRQGAQQKFTTEENEKNRTAAADLQTQRDIAAARRAQVSANARIQAAEKAGLSGELNPKQMSVTLQLMNSLKGQPAYSDMQDIATGLDGVAVGVAQKNGLGDITAINSFQRMVDPGATVREGDVTLIQTASALAERILSEYPIEKLRAGAKLPEATRKQMMDTAAELYERRAKNYNDSVGQQYRLAAKAAGIPFEYIGQEFASKKKLAAGGGQIQPGEKSATNPKTGEVLVLRNGKWVKP